MKRNTKRAIVIGVAFILLILIVFIIADKQFEQSGQTIKVGMEFKSDKVDRLEKEKNHIIEELKAVNADLTHQSVLNYRIREEADSIITKEKKANAFLRAQIKIRDEENDSLRAVIRSIRQSDI